MAAKLRQLFQKPVPCARVQTTWTPGRGQGRTSRACAFPLPARGGATQISRFFASASPSWKSKIDRAQTRGSLQSNAWTETRKRAPCVEKLSPGRKATCCHYCRDQSGGHRVAWARASPRCAIAAGHRYFGIAFPTTVHRPACVASCCQPAEQTSSAPGTILVALWSRYCGRLESLELRTCGALVFAAVPAARVKSPARRRGRASRVDGVTLENVFPEAWLIFQFGVARRVENPCSEADPKLLTSAGHSNMEMFPQLTLLSIMMARPPLRIFRRYFVRPKIGRLRFGLWGRKIYNDSVGGVFTKASAYLRSNLVEADFTHSHCSMPEN
jgi:hypothetical protein